MSEQDLGNAALVPTSDSEAANTLLLDFLLVLLRHQRLVLGLPILAGMVAATISYLLPSWYTASAKIMPPQQSQSNAVAILGQLGALTGGASQAFGLKNPSDIYIAMLRSRTVADRLIQRFDLKQVYDEELLYYTRKKLTRNSSFAAGREGVITIEVEDKDPVRAANLANGYVDELRGLTIHLAVSEASQRRLFFEGQLSKAKNDLVAAEVELKKFSLESGLVNPQGQIGLSVAAAAALRAQITAREIQLSAMRSFATETNPDMMRAFRELTSLRGELAKMEQNAGAGKGDVMVPFGKAPEVGLEYVRKFRDVKYFETLFEVLAKQYEIAKIDEAKDATLIQVLDTAPAPERRSWPRRSLIVLVTMLMAFLVAIFAAHLVDSLGRIKQNRELSGKYVELRALLPFGRNFLK
jgi:tyrosine-protein kinase Etk/Wzc